MTEDTSTINEKDRYDKAVDHVRELFKTIIAASGIMLGLLSGLTRSRQPVPLPTSASMDTGVSSLIYIAAILLAVSIFVSFIGCQFIIAELERGTIRITKEPTVAFSYLAAWIIFFAGSVMLMFTLLFK